MSEQIHAKTYKREIGYGLLALWVAVTIWVFIGLPPAMVENYERIYETLTWVTWIYVGSMMGLKVYQNIAAGKLGAS